MMSTARRSMTNWVWCAVGISVWAAAPAASALTKVVAVGPGGSLTFSPSTVRVNGRCEKSTDSTQPKLVLAPKRSACFCIRVINS